MNSRSLSWMWAFLLALASAAFGLDLKPKIDPLAKPLIEDRTVVGLVIGIYDRGQTQVLGYGEAVKGKGIEPDRHTVYEIGSVTKVFTSILLAEMVERGLVQLDDPVQKYLPEGLTTPVADEKPITLENLATHRSGLPRMPDNFEPADPQNPYADYDAKRMFASLSKHKLRRPPGKSEYSNYAMGLLGELLARKAGKSYEELLAERITGPIKMTETRITLDDGMRQRLAPPYSASLEPKHNWDLDAMAGAGGIRSTVDDLLRFIEANLSTNDTPLNQALHLAQEKRHALEGGLSIGLGWHIARDGVTRWHSGMTGGYHAWLAIIPDRKLGVVVLANTATMKVTEFGERVTQLAFGLDVKPPVVRKMIEVDTATLARFVGSYELFPKFVLTITVEGGALMAQATGQPKFPIFAESPAKFFYKVVDAQVTFVPDKDGKVSKIILHQGGRDIEGKRSE